MSTAIAVTSPDLILPVGGRQPAGVRVCPPPRAQSLEDALAETSAVLEQHGFLVVLYPAAAPREVIRRLHTVRSVLESDRMALLPLELPPLAVGFLARQLAQLTAYDFGPGVIASAARLLVHYLHAGAVLGSVTKLDRVPVTLTSHVKSWMPGAQFAVLAVPRPRLVRIGAEGGGLPGPDFGTGLTFAQGQLDADWITGTLGPAWRVQDVQQVPLPAASAQWWATPKVAEFVAGISEAAVLSRLVASVRRERCPWCGLEIIGDRCVVCSAQVPGPAAAAAGAAPPMPRSAPGPAPATRRGALAPRGTAPRDEPHALGSGTHTGSAGYGPPPPYDDPRSGGTGPNRLRPAGIRGPDAGDPRGRPPGRGAGQPGSGPDSPGPRRDRPPDDDRPDR